MHQSGQNEASRHARTIFARHSRRIAQAIVRFAIWCGGIAVFAVVAGHVHVHGELALDRAMVEWLAERRAHGVNAAMHALTQLGSARWLAAVAMAATALLALRRHFRSATYVALVSAGAALSNELLKHLFARARPELSLVTADGFAFPSGHAMGSAAVYGAIAVVVATRFPRLGVPLLIACITLVLGIGLSRMYLGVHYPTDVIAGWALGLTWALWLKPPVLGRGFRAQSIPESDLAADRFSSSALKDSRARRWHSENR